MQFALLVKPVGGACNLDCSYCFYKNHPPGRMDPSLFADMLESYCSLPFSAKSVTLQGGEPLLSDSAILDALQNAPVERALQTNGTLVTADTARFLAAGNWLVGVSLDGPEPLNRLRGDSFAQTLRGIRTLEDAGVDYNLLTVVSRANVNEPIRVYEYLRDNFSTRYHQYIECTGPQDPVDGEQWGRFLIALFDAWIRHDVRTVSIRLFDSIVSTLLRGYPTQCSQSDTCRHYLTVESDGSVYPCDFFVDPSLRLGNVATDSWEAMLESPKYRNFVNRKVESLSDECLKCEYLNLCRGDCPRSQRRLCAGWRAFFRHALPQFAELAAGLVARPA